MTHAADALTWNLADLYAGPDDPAILGDGKEARALAVRLAERHQGRIASLAAAGLRAVLVDYEALVEKAFRPGAYASLLFAADSRDPVAQALLVRTREEATETLTMVKFLEVELRAAPEDVFAAWRDSQELAAYRHFLVAQRLRAPHTLGEPEERVAAMKTLTGAAAWVQLFEETLALVRVPLTVEGEARELTIDEVRALRSSPDRDLRRRAVTALHEAHKGRAHVLNFVFNTLFQDHKIEVDLRRYPSVMAPTLLDDELSAEAVEALMATTEAHYPLAQRYFRAKARFLGLDDFASHDLMAPLPGGERRVSWDEACRLVLDSFASFSPRFADLARQHMERRWIDVMPRPGKAGGAFCSASFPSLHPYVLLNFNQRLDDVSTLAHELGHAIHFSLAGRQTLLNFGPTTPMAETASVFGEIVLVRRLLDEERDPVARRALLAQRIEDILATVFRQVMYTRWEQLAHARRAEGVATAEEYGALWREQLTRLYGDAVRLDAEEWGWIGIPHFIHSRFYCYSYAFGQMLVLALYRRYVEEGSSFVPRYEALLAGGGSDAPERLLSTVGIDIHAPGFWQAGLDALGGLIEEFERS